MVVVLGALVLIAPPCFLFVPYVVAVFLAARWTHVRRRARRCLRCDYSLVGLPELRCPECGLAFKRAAPRVPQPTIVSEILTLCTVWLIAATGSTVASAFLWRFAPKWAGLPDNYSPGHEALVIWLPLIYLVAWATILVRRQRRWYPLIFMAVCASLLILAGYRLIEVIARFD